jgi:IS1 family transposase
VRSKRVQCDEIWSFVYAKEKNVPEDKKSMFGVGDAWTWTALDADSKLMLSWKLGARDTATAYEFMQDLAGRLANRVQLTTDGHRPYLAAVEDAFGADIDYAMLVKIYGADANPEKRYSPAVCLGCKVHAAMLSIYFMYYNFRRVHQTLRVTPAMEAGIANHVWTIEQIVELLD